MSAGICCHEGASFQATHELASAVQRNAHEYIFVRRKKKTRLRKTIDTETVVRREESTEEAHGDPDDNI